MQYAEKSIANWCKMGLELDNLAGKKLGTAVSIVGRNGLDHSCRL